ncbi:MAG TPA: ethylbenzene dehydrogenase-related protein [Candidatus Wujingus californicus]|uniref:ethylbenzene dehydrogenase-related protein n=2 Tax=Candidatus Wujingus californicus TaxID=3367618 RepID=UPI001D51E834|nr:hypothetical protein [Planctomycetota bacterium]MDO8130527.1 ethylbenzene dehydrogenase-related protein [Candidatus Brocadiales bacterium]
MKYFLSIISSFFLCFYSICGWCGESEYIVWTSHYTKIPPVVDGKMDKAWETATFVTVMAREAIGGDKPIPVILRALHTEDTLYVMAKWHDTTKSDMRDPFIWNAEKKDYDRPSKPDDQFALEFPISGNFDIRMITLAHEYIADVWHWKAGRGNPIGWVDDKRHIISQKPIQNGVEYSMGGHGNVFIARLMDEGTSSYFLKPKPNAFEGNVVDSFEQRQPAGSLADVHGRGIHDGKNWTLEMSRKFNTGHSDDAVIDPTKENMCAIAVLDDELYWNHSVSPVITLRFIGNKTD